jgi:DNA polymerase-1
MTDRVVLVDGSAMVFRAFFAIPGNFSTATGLHTNAVYGFTLMFKKMFAGKTPSYGAVVFDAPGKTFRDERYPEYKAQRPRMPGDLKEQLPWIDKVVEVHNFPILRVPGVEADDVIGTLAKEAKEAGMEVHIISGDKDFAQLVDDDVRMIDAIRDITYDSELVRKKWGVPPHQFVDLLALLGDKIDNIPGVPGIGQKGAAALLDKYGDLETLLSKADELKGRQKTALTEHADLARLSKELATINVHVPLEQGVTDLVVKAPDQGTLNDLYKELEFYSLLEQDEVRDAFDDDRWDFKTLQAEADVKAFLSDVKGDDLVAAYAVFDEPHPTVGTLVGLALSVDLGSAVFVPLSGEGIAEEGAREALKAWLEDETKQKVFHNVKWASIALTRAGVELKGTAFDTMLASFLVDPTKIIPHTLFGLAKEYLHRTLPPQKSITGSGKSEKRFSEVELDQVST